VCLSWFAPPSSRASQVTVAAALVPLPWVTIGPEDRVAANSARSGLRPRGTKASGPLAVHAAARRLFGALQMPLSLVLPGIQAGRRLPRGIPPTGYLTGCLFVDATVGGPDREEEDRHRDPDSLRAVVAEEPDGRRLRPARRRPAPGLASGLGWPWRNQDEPLGRWDGVSSMAVRTGNRRGRPHGLTA
jgi:hypothetical protein